MAKTVYTIWDRAYQKAWVHFWRKRWYQEIIDNLNLR